MPDDLVERLRKAFAAWGLRNLGDEAADRITTLTGRLAELERATPEEVVEMAAKAAVADLINDTPDSFLYVGESRDLTDILIDGNVDFTQMARVVISAIAPTLCAQGVAAEREKAAELANSVYISLIGGDPVPCACGNGRIPTQAYRAAVDAYAARIRAGWSGG